MDNNTNHDNNQKYSDLGSQIKESVMSAVNSGDFSGLSNTINQSVFTVLGDVGSSINRAAEQALKFDASEAKAKAQRYQDEYEAKIQRNKEKRAAYVQKPNQVKVVLKNDKFVEIGRFSAPASIISGVVTTAAALIILDVAVSLLTKDVISVFGVIPFIGFVGLTLWHTLSGVKKKKLLKTARRYKQIASEKMYCAVDDIARLTGTDQKKVVKNIKKMLEKGFFPEGHLDDDNTTFMMSNEIYEEYRRTQKERLALAKEQLESSGVEEEKSGVLTSEQQTELATMMSEGQKGINRLHQLNDEIPGEEISAKLDMTENLLNEIFGRVREHPELMQSCHKLMDYYLPTMLKLVEAYAEYDKVSVPGPDIIGAKDEIEKTLDTINDAFRELLNKLFRDSVWDVTADAKVLTSMLKQEGLVEDRFAGTESAPDIIDATDIFE